MSRFTIFGVFALLVVQPVSAELKHPVETCELTFVADDEFNDEIIAEFEEIIASRGYEIINTVRWSALDEGYDQTIAPLILFSDVFWVPDSATDELKITMRTTREEWGDNHTYYWDFYLPLLFGGKYADRTSLFNRKAKKLLKKLTHCDEVLAHEG